MSEFTDEDKRNWIEAAGIRIQMLEQENTALRQRIAALNECRAVLEHAIELGYLGEGSTASWAREALEQVREVEVDE